MGDSLMCQMSLKEKNKASTLDTPVQKPIWKQAGF